VKAKGKLNSYTSEILKYQIYSEYGMSGSPIYYSDNLKNKIIIGVHILNNLNEKNGVYINKKILKWIKSYYKQYKIKTIDWYSNYLKSWNFPISMKVS
jgi:V8-like Glu-specific endopeptidase